MSQEEEVNYHKDRADKAEAELENHKRESKELEELLENESKEKEAEIRKLKEQSILKEKQYKTQKKQLTAILSENATLKTNLITLQQELSLLKSSQSPSPNPSSLQALEEENGSLKQKIDNLTVQIHTLESHLKNAQGINKNMREEWVEKEKILKEQIQTEKNIVNQLKKYNQILNEKLVHSKQQSLNKQKVQESTKGNGKGSSEEEGRVRKYEQKLKNLENAYQQLEETIKEKDKEIYELKSTIHQLHSQLDLLQSRPTPHPPIAINLTQSSSIPSPLTLKSSQQQLDYFSPSNSINYSCLVLTKPHYISPFLQIYQDKHMVKIYKSTRTGCFQKAMGYYRHSFDRLSFEQEAIIDPIISTVTMGKEAAHHSVIIYGSKRCNKKEMFAKILVKLKHFIIGKLENAFDAEAIYINQSQEEDEKCMVKGNNKSSILQIMDRIIALGYKNDKQTTKIGQSPSKKVQARPTLRYFSFISSSCFIEVATSSYTSQSFNKKTSTVNMLNNLLYSKLPDILQSAISQKHIILTINPIVDLYQECKNTLTTTFCKNYVPKYGQEQHKWKGSPIKEELNDLVRKKMDFIERQNEQTQLKTRRLEEQCMYYRTRFDQLEFRLKNLLNTHSGQNCYLKKSPVTLSYEKLLKFIHSVQSYRPTHSQLNNNTIYIEKDNESVDAL